MRIALTFVLALHAAIHLLGFLKWSKIAALPQLSGRTLTPLSGVASHAFGLLWFLGFALLLAAALLRVGRHEAWWLPALGGAVLSQALIVVAWHDAKFGTLANVLIVVPAIVAAGHARFERHVDAEVRALLAQPSTSRVAPVRQADLQPLPAPVRKWLEASGIVGRERARTVRLKQRGDLRTSPDGAWMPAEAEQYFAVDEPAFIWKVDSKMIGFLPVVGRDKYAAGTGHMLIKAAAFVNVVDVADGKIAHGAMLRFLGEIVWFPSAALSPYIEWRPVDATSARATMRHAGLTASAVFTFSEQGRVLGLRADRYLGGGEDAKLTPWSVLCSEWSVIRGVEIPTRGDVVWTLPEGDFSYYRWEILDVEYNRTQLYKTPVSGAHSRFSGPHLQDLPPWHV